MTRELLLEKICFGDCVYNCVFYGSCECDYCKVKLNELLDEYDKHVIEQYKADINLNDTIKDIHDNVAREMYCKGIDDMVKNLISNSRTEIIDEKLMLIVTEERIKTVANEMKKRLDS